FRGGDGGFDRYQPRHRPAMPGQDDLFARFGAADQFRQVPLGVGHRNPHRSPASGPTISAHGPISGPCQSRRWLDSEICISYVYPTCRTEGPMQVQVARWGNSLGLRIPKDIALRAGLREGARVDVEAEGDRIIISPVRPRYVLAELLKGMTPQAMREAFDWGPDKGREIVK